jgi:L-aminopeptidase/D-esterase-like protein
LNRLAKRAALGLARNGSIASNGSGDIFIAFSTANEDAGRGIDSAAVTMLPNDTINPLFRATVEATEEAIINALVAGRDMAGNGGSVVHGIDHNRLVDVLRHHQRIVEP